MTKYGLKHLISFGKMLKYKFNRQFLLGIFIGFVIGGLTVVMTTPVGGVYHMTVTDNKFLYDGTYLTVYNRTPSESGTLVVISFCVSRGWHMYVDTDGAVVGVAKMLTNGEIIQLAPRDNYIIDKDMSVAIFILNMTYVNIDLVVI